MVHFQWSNINLLAVSVAWIVHIVMGLIWFHPHLFGKEWSKLTGIEMKPAPMWIVPGFMGHLLMVLVLAALIASTNVHDAMGGMMLGLMAWAGFIVPMEIGELVWEKIPFRLFMLRIGNQFLGIAVSGIILGAWQ